MTTLIMDFTLHPLTFILGEMQIYASHKYIIFVCMFIGWNLLVVYLLSNEFDAKAMIKTVVKSYMMTESEKKKKFGCLWFIWSVRQLTKRRHFYSLPKRCICWQFNKQIISYDFTSKKKNCIKMATNFMNCNNLPWWIYAFMHLNSGLSWSVHFLANVSNDISWHICDGSWQLNWAEKVTVMNQIFTWFGISKRQKCAHIAQPQFAQVAVQTEIIFVIITAPNSIYIYITRRQE